MINNKLRIDINRLNLCQNVYKIIPKPLYSQDKFEIKRRRRELQNLADGVVSSYKISRQLEYQIIPNSFLVRSHKILFF